MKLAIIGNGNIVHAALTALQEIKDIEVHALCVRPQSIEKGEKLQSKYFIPYLYTDYEEVLNNPNIDFVYIGIINIMHYQYARLALLHGKNVIIEKPSCIKSSEIQEIVAIAKEKQLFLFEAVTFLHQDYFKHIKAVLPSIGRVKIIECNFSKYSSRYTQYLSGKIHPVFNPQYAGGALLDLNIYNLNFVVSLFGMPDQAFYYPVKGYNGIDTSGVAVLSYPNFVAMCAAAKDSTSPCFMQIQAENGWIKVDGSPDNLKLLTICKNDKKEEISLLSKQHRMVDEFKDFLQIYKSCDYNMMNEYLQISIQVCTLTEQFTKH